MSEPPPIVPPKKPGVVPQYTSAEPLAIGKGALSRSAPTDPPVGGRFVPTTVYGEVVFTCCNLSHRQGTPGEALVGVHCPLCGNAFRVLLHRALIAERGLFPVGVKVRLTLPTTVIVEGQERVLAVDQIFEIGEDLYRMLSVGPDQSLIVLHTAGAMGEERVAFDRQLLVSVPSSNLVLADAATSGA